MNQAEVRAKLKELAGRGATYQDRRKGGLSLKWTFGGGCGHIRRDQQGERLRFERRAKRAVRPGDRVELGNGGSCCTGPYVRVFLADD